jgi:phosphoribosylanthranilate isomerase
VADLTRDALAQLEREVGLDRLQLHGDEPPELLRALGARAFKAVRVGAPEDVDRARAYDGLLLLDAKVPGELGGTGRPVDRTLAAALAAERPVLLAGGLGPDNVREAALAVRPWGVDTASGVELSPGVKDLAAVARFVREARP